MKDARTYVAIGSVITIINNNYQVKNHVRKFFLPKEDSCGQIIPNTSRAALIYFDNLNDIACIDKVVTLKAFNEIKGNFISPA